MHEAIVKALESGGDYNKAVVEAAAPIRQVIETMLQSEPFLPFRIHLTGKSVYEIADPRRVRVGPCAVTIGEPDAVANEGFRWRAILALIHVVRLEPLFADEPTVV